MFGVIWVLCGFYPFIDMVCSFVGVNPHADHIDAARLSVVLAAFHTTFNVCNTAVLIWFIPQMERFVCYVIKPSNRKDEDDFRLRYIGGTSIMKTPELSVLEAQKEIQSFAERIQRMFGMVRELLGVKDEAKFNKLYTRIEKYESISDNMEIEIANYLNNVSDAHLSDDTKAKIRAMLREISEIESIGDSCYNVARTLSRKLKGKEDFTEKQYEHLHQMLELTDDALTQMNVMLTLPSRLARHQPLFQRGERDKQLPQPAPLAEHQRHQRPQVHLRHRHNVYGHRVGVREAWRLCGECG